MICSKVARVILVCASAVFILSYTTLVETEATPCIVTFANAANIDYYEIEINGVLYELESSDPQLNLDIEELLDGVYDISITPVNEDGKPAPVYFTISKWTYKNKSYYTMTPELGYEESFSDPLDMTINTRAGKAVGN